MSNVKKAVMRGRNEEQVIDLWCARQEWLRGRMPWPGNDRILSMAGVMAQARFNRALEFLHDDTFTNVHVRYASTGRWSDQAVTHQLA